jgi:hypothetical protein
MAAGRHTRMLLRVPRAWGVRHKDEGHLSVRGSTDGGRGRGGRRCGGGNMIELRGTKGDCGGAHERESRRGHEGGFQERGEHGMRGLFSL